MRLLLLVLKLTTDLIVFRNYYLEFQSRKIIRMRSLLFATFSYSFPCIVQQRAGVKVWIRHFEIGQKELGLDTL